MNHAGRNDGRLGLLLCAAAVLGSCAVFSAWGVEPAAAGPASVASVSASALPLALMWMLGAWGLGLVLARAAERKSGAPIDASLALGLGVALMLWVSHALGALRLLSRTPAGALAAWAPVVAGAAIALGRFGGAARGRRLGCDSSVWIWMAAGPALGVLWVASCAPPGTLWRSEALGFDIVSYHLQLPRVWLADGLLGLRENSAYSGLPSYVEAAYLQMGAMWSWRSFTRSAGEPFLDGAAGPTHAAAFLHALMGLAAAWNVSKLAREIRLPDAGGSQRVGAEGSPAPAATREETGWFAGALFIAIPWVIVTASLAYNEMAVLLGLACALRVALRTEPGPVWRGALAAVLVGAACGAKPTAIVTVALPVGLVLAMRVPVRWWILLALSGTATGALMLGPWLVRNVIEAGNPVFPFGLEFFGRGHWTELEAARWHAGTGASGGLLWRAGLFFTERGAGHAQWSIFMVLVAIGAALACSNRSTRRGGLIMTAVILVQVAAWAAVGHQQSRFLLPIAAPGAALVCLALSGGGRARAALRAALVLLLSGSTAWTFLREHDGAPNAGLVGGVGALTGELFAEMPVEAAETRALHDELGPAAWVNLNLGRGEGASRTVLMLLGDSTPYYFRVRLVEQTTWDVSPLGSALRRSGGDLSRAVSDLASAPPAGLGVTHVLVNFNELERLRGDGWYDPDVSLEVARRLIDEHGRVLRSWLIGRGGSHLIELHGGSVTE